MNKETEERGERGVTTSGQPSAGTTTTLSLHFPQRIYEEREKLKRRGEREFRSPPLLLHRRNCFHNLIHLLYLPLLFSSVFDPISTIFLRINSDKNINFLQPDRWIPNLRTTHWRKWGRAPHIWNWCWSGEVEIRAWSDGRKWVWAWRANFCEFLTPIYINVMRCLFYHIVE